MGVSVRPWRPTSFHRSTSSSPPWTAPTSWAGCWTPSTPRHTGAFRVLLVDQNDDDRLDDVLAGHPALELVR